MVADRLSRGSRQRRRQRQADHPLGRSLLALALLVAGSVLAAVAADFSAGRSLLPAGRQPAAAASVSPVEAGPARPLEQPLEGGNGRTGAAGDGQTPEPAPAGMAAIGGEAVPSPEEEAVVTLTNQQRLAAGCPPVTWQPTLARAALVHAQDMVRRDYFEHVSPSGQSPADRAELLGFTGGVGENLALGYETADDAVTGWMESPGHRANILDCRFGLIGVSYVDATIESKGSRGVWVQEFGTRS